MCLWSLCLLWSLLLEVNLHFWNMAGCFMPSSKACYTVQVQRESCVFRLERSFSETPLWKKKVLPLWMLKSCARIFLLSYHRYQSQIINQVLDCASVILARCDNILQFEIELDLVIFWIMLGFISFIWNTCFVCVTLNTCIYLWRHFSGLCSFVI